MSHFAKVENGIVTQVIVAEADFISTGALGDPAGWVQTSYNTRGNVHYDQNGNVDAEGVRGNYAGIGYTYDAQNDVFVAPQPSPEYILNTATWTWWNPNDPEQSQPVKPAIPVVVIEEPVVEAVIETPVAEEVTPVVETVVETPVEEVAPVVEEPVVEAVVEVPAEVVVESPAVVETVTETPTEEVVPVETPVNPV
jgi:hypothetical protein